MPIIVKLSTHYLIYYLKIKGKIPPPAAKNTKPQEVTTRLKFPKFHHLGKTQNLQIEIPAKLDIINSR